MRNLLILILLLVLPGESGAASHDQRDMLATARTYIAAHHPWQGMRTEISSGSLDERTQLPACPVALEAFLPPGSRIGQRTSVGVRCPVAPGWRLYVPVNVAVMADVLVAVRALPPGQVLTPADVQTVTRDIAGLGYGYLSALPDDSSLRMRTAVAQGAVLTPALTDAALAVRRGQRVSLQSESSLISVSMSGVALADAALGARLQVRNSQSGKVVEGIVRSSDVVAMP